METQVGEMEKNVAEIQSLFCSPETLCGPKEEHLKVMRCGLRKREAPSGTQERFGRTQMLERRIRSVRSGVADIQEAKSGLRLPEKADETLTVFRVTDQLQTLLLDLEKVHGSSTSRAGLAATKSPHVLLSL